VRFEICEVASAIRRTLDATTVVIQAFVNAARESSIIAATSTIPRVSSGRSRSP
jgi:hypothetical protein